MRTFLRSLLIAVFLIAAWGLLGPWLRHGLYAMRLASMPAPTALAMPVDGVRPKGLRDTWHAQRGGGRRHEGIDIFAKRGTPVLAATEGIVLRTGTNRLGGQVVWMLGPGGQRHYYAHLDGFSDVVAGMRVEEGRVLGYVGNTGNAASTPPHLHYGVYGVEGAVNPYPLLRGGPGRGPADATR
ncbi:M23 family metallopeptidase [Telluria aromaticivorans]|uniref:M23 family metallopeptidase n=1 Tax=Telluria aromaticivorans TaxID=2725995 RepID=A0A7Y2NY16_9BURK|nr:M23 family metallopeptidase [Telluria aromaticivorans]NNG21519.1 M23 family metallopeptidase [Telluria aromaticivorans]